MTDKPKACCAELAALKAKLEEAREVAATAKSMAYKIDGPDLAPYSWGDFLVAAMIEKSSAIADNDTRATAFMDASWIIWEKVVATAAGLKVVRRCREAIEAEALRINPGAKRTPRPEPCSNCDNEGHTRKGDCALLPEPKR